MGIAGQVLLGADLLSDDSQQEINRRDPLLAIDHQEFLQFGRSCLFHDDDGPEKMFDLVYRGTPLKFLDDLLLQVDEKLAPLLLLPTIATLEKWNLEANGPAERFLERAVFYVVGWHGSS